MIIKQAILSDLETVKKISQITISEIFPHYYPQGAVKFFLEHHNETNIINDIKQNQILLCLDEAQNAIGTVTIKGNEICRLFVLPSQQKSGYGTKMLDYAEKLISRQFSTIVLASSLPAKGLYLKRGYKTYAFNIIAVSDNDFLCYDVMSKQI